MEAQTSFLSAEVANANTEYTYLVSGLVLQRLISSPRQEPVPSHRRCGLLFGTVLTLLFIHSLYSTLFKVPVHGPSEA
ncbi:MAG: hypothetical protein AAF851_04200 [Myxococcota bacterium]